MTLRWQRNLWLVLVVATLGACALLAGNTLAHVLDERLLDDDAVVVWPSPRRAWMPPGRLPAPPAKDAEQVIRRNLFCSRCDRADGGPTTPSGPRDGWVQSALPVELVSSLWIPAEPSKSLAVIRDTSSRRGDARLFAVGRVLFETQAVILRIDPRRVLLDNRAFPGGRHEYLAFDAARASSPSPPASEWRLSGTVAGTPPLDGVRCRADGCEVDRGLVDRVLRTPARFFGTSRAEPVVESGRPAGFRVYSVAPGSLLAALGLHNGDTLRSVNGRELVSFDGVLAAVTALRSASRVELDVMRTGAGPVRLRYDVR